MDSSPSKKIVIAVDGYSSCGKSTFARALAARLGYVFIDTGAMYRAVTLRALEEGAFCGGTVDERRVVELLDGMDISFRFNPARQASDIYVDGKCVEDRIRSVEVSDTVSSVSRIPAVRARLVALQQSMGRDKGVVMDGRDIGTVVFPDAELKLFMTADPEVRAARRYRELRAAGHDVSLAEIEDSVRRRDWADEHREVSPLRRAVDAVVLDNSRMTPQEQMVWIEPLLRERIGQSAAEVRNEE